jgi:hypothetical protein
LAFVRFKSTAKTPGPPIVYLAGGPGRIYGKCSLLFHRKERQMRLSSGCFRFYFG